jgi:hypothetical protein
MTEGQIEESFASPSGNNSLNVMNIRDELTHFLRYSDVLSITVRNVTTYSGSYTASEENGESTHTFTGFTPVRDFKSIEVNGTPKYYIRDYTMDWNSGVLTWTSSLPQTGDLVTFTLDYGTGDKIYPDLPRDDLKLTSYPRVGVELLSVSTKPLGLGGSAHINDIAITIFCWSPANKDSSVAGGYGGLSDIESTINLIRNSLRTNAKNFYSFQWITPLGRGPLTKSHDNKVMQLSQDYVIKFLVETI